MNRPTIAQLAKSAGVSPATVNRLLRGAGGVRQDKIDQVLKAAEEIGFYGIGAIRDRRRDALPRYRLGFLLQQSHRKLYQTFSQHIIDAVAQRKDALIEPDVFFEDDLSPEAIAKNLLHLGGRNDAVALISADHPLISHAINTLRASGTPVVAYITDQSAAGRAGFVGADNWKLGRTAAWIICQMTCRPGTIATFIGNHRYHCQDIADASLRSFIRENAPLITVADAIPTQEEPANAYRLVRGLLAEQPDLVGIFVGGGGISGVLRAMRETPVERQKCIRIVCRDLGPETHKGLSEKLVTAALCHPLPRISSDLIDVMITSIRHSMSGTVLQRVVPFDIITPENLVA